MERLSPPCSKTVSILPLSAQTLINHNFPSTCFFFPWPNGGPLTLKNPLTLPTPSTSLFTVNCRDGIGDEILSPSSAYDVLGVVPNCSPADLKAAFRAKVKQFHPDVRKDGKISDTMIRRVIQAYQILSKFTKTEIIERECLDPFEEPECEAFDLFVNEVLCVGKGCPYSCVERAPNAFAFASSTGTARAASQGHGEDYRVQLVSALEVAFIM